MAGWVEIEDRGHGNTLKKELVDGCVFIQGVALPSQARPVPGASRRRRRMRAQYRSEALDTSSTIGPTALTSKSANATPGPAAKHSLQNGAGMPIRRRSRDHLHDESAALWASTIATAISSSVR